MGKRPEGLLGKLYDAVAKKNADPTGTIGALVSSAADERVIGYPIVDYLNDVFGLNGQPQLSRAQAIERRSTTIDSKPIYDEDANEDISDAEFENLPQPIGWEDKTVPVYGVEERVDRWERRAYKVMKAYINVRRPVTNRRTREITDLPWSMPNAKTGGMARERVIRLLEFYGKPLTVGGLYSLFREAETRGYFQAPETTGFGPKILETTYATLKKVGVALPQINLVKQA